MYTSKGDIKEIKVHDAMGHILWRGNLVFWYDCLDSGIGGYAGYISGCSSSHLMLKIWKNEHFVDYEIPLYINGFPPESSPEGKEIKVHLYSIIALPTNYFRGREEYNDFVKIWDEFLDK